MKVLLSELSVNKQNVSNSVAANWEYDGKQGRVLILTFKADKEPDKEVQLYYFESQGKIKTGAGIIQSINGKQKIEAYDVDKGKVYHAATIDVVNKTPKITWREGPFVPSNATEVQGEVTASSSSSCSECKTWCNYILGTLNCSIGGLFFCAAACGPAIGICAVICANLWGLVCTYGTNVDCNSFCTYEGYCP